MLAHPSCDVRHHFASGLQLDPKSSVRKGLRDSALDFEGFFFFSQNLTFSKI